MPVSDGGVAAETIYLYGKPGCHLCEEARGFLQALLADRRTGGGAAYSIVERDIESNDSWLRDFSLTIPVLELAGRRLEVATSPAKIRAFLGETIDGASPAPDNRLSC